MYKTNGYLLNIKILGEKILPNLCSWQKYCNTSIGPQTCTLFLSPKEDNCSEIIACGYSPNLSPNACSEVASTTSVGNLSQCFVTCPSLESFLYNKRVLKPPAAVWSHSSLIIASENPVTSLHLEESRRKGKTIVLMFCINITIVLMFLLNFLPYSQREAGLLVPWQLPSLLLLLCEAQIIFWEVVLTSSSSQDTWLKKKKKRIYRLYQ